jgi:hypothetical protein
MSSFYYIDRYGQLYENLPKKWAIFSLKKCINSDKKWFCYILCDFFTNSSGHPAAYPPLLKTGLRYVDDGYFPATPCCKRAVREAAAILESLGHEVVPFSMPHNRELVPML